MIHSVHTPSHKILYIVKIFCVDIVPGAPKKSIWSGIGLNRHYFYQL